MKGECNEMLLSFVSLLTFLYKLQSRKGMLGSKDQGGGVDGACVTFCETNSACRVLVENPDQNTAWKTGCILKGNIKMNFKER
jgi:hypothetical protein